MKLATLHLMVGLPCSGKTLLAKKLEIEYSAIRLTPDEWQIPLFGQDAESPEHDKRHGIIETLLWELAKRALIIGTNVILDYGFWAREEREYFRKEAKKLGASSEIHYLDVSVDEIIKRLRERNKTESNMHFYIPEEYMKKWIESFQKPTPDELIRKE
jgi:predicted kinase